jgi:hypothetical protein
MGAVELDRSFGRIKFAGDPRVQQPGDNQAHHLPLLRGKLLVKQSALPESGIAESTLLAIPTGSSLPDGVQKKA